jgi:hypothetical protein
MNQLSWIDGPLARGTDHDSSHLAAEAARARGDVYTQARAVAGMIRRWPGRTTKELSLLARVDRYMVGRRAPEAERQGWVHAHRVPGRQITWWPGSGCVLCARDAEEAAANHAMRRR